MIKRAAHTRRRYMRRINAARIVGRSVNPDKTQWVTAIASLASNGVRWPAVAGCSCYGTGGISAQGREVRPAIEAVSQSPILANYRFNCCERSECGGLHLSH